MSDEINDNESEDDVKFEKTPEELTGFSKGPPLFNRGKARTVLFVVLGAFAAAAIAMSLVDGSKGKPGAADPTGFAATPPRDFLRNELERAVRQSESENPAPAADAETFVEELEVDAGQWGPPAVTQAPVQPAVQVQQYPQQPSGGQREAQPQLSPLIPKVEGNLFPSAAPAAAQAQAAYDPYDPYQAAYSSYPPSTDYSGLLSSLASPAGQGQSASEAAQDNKIDFYGGASGGALSGYFLQDDALWIGTIIPAVLVTAINTDLPGNVIARVTQNIYDSRTGKNLLIPQGTLLMAQYNSSVSYAQRRVQIVWDILIRPDGYQVELEGMNGVDPQGMAGIRAAYKENWFEYVKAAGIITLFSVANAKLTEEVAQRTSDQMAEAVVTANAEFVRDIGGNLISRAIEIQPTLTVANGERINVMLNKNIFLPPVPGYPVTERYTLR